MSNTAFLVVILIVVDSLWKAAANGHSGRLGDYSSSSLLWYIFGAQLASTSVRFRMIEEIGDEIGNGGIAIAMLRPVSVVGMQLAIALGEGFARVIPGIFGGALVTLFMAGAPPSWTGVALGTAVAVPLGLAVNIVFATAFAGIAFWLMDARSSWFLYQKLVFLPGGMLIPLELFPNTLAHACMALPFAAMVYVPGRIMSGHLDISLVLEQVIWLAVALGCAVAIFARGQKRLEVTGG